MVRVKKKKTKNQHTFWNDKLSFLFSICSTSAKGKSFLWFFLIWLKLSVCRCSSWWYSDGIAKYYSCEDYHSHIWKLVSCTVGSSPDFQIWPWVCWRYHTFTHPTPRLRCRSKPRLQNGNLLRLHEPQQTRRLSGIGHTVTNDVIQKD